MNGRYRALVVMALAVMTLTGSACSPPPNAPLEPSIQSDAVPAGAARRRVIVYASEREQLHTLALDGQTGALSMSASISLPEQVHYAAADRTARFLYVSASDGATRHGLYAFAIDPEAGTLAQHGPSLVPPLGRIIHLSVDPAGRHLVLAHNRAGQLSSVELAADGSLAHFVEQAAPVQTGFFTHQALLDPSGSWLVACGLGADASDTAPEQPGSLTLFRHHQGQLTQQQSVLPGPGLGPRHLDYAGEHVYVAMERGNRLFTYRYGQGTLGERPAFEASTLLDAEGAVPGQRAGAIHVHPSGKYVYVSNRANRTSRFTLAEQPAEVFAGGKNNIALFALEPGSGEPRRVEHYDTRGFEPRTFSIEPSGRFLIVANQSERTVLDQNVLDAKGSLRVVPRSLVVFEIGEHGRLSYRHDYPFTGGDLFWILALQLPR